MREWVHRHPTRVHQSRQPRRIRSLHRFDHVTVMLLPELILMRLMFVLIGTENYGLAMVGVAVATIPRCLHYAALAGMLASRFPAHLWYTGISTGPVRTHHRPRVHGPQLGDPDVR